MFHWFGQQIHGKGCQGKKMKKSFNALSNLVNLLSTSLIVDEKNKAKQLTDLQLFSHIKKYTQTFFVPLTNCNLI